MYIYFNLFMERKNLQYILYVILPKIVHCKKELAVFPSPAGMSQIKLFLGGNNLVFSRPERVWSVTSRLGTGKWLTLFLQCIYCAIAFPPAPLLCCFCLFLYLLKWEIIYSLSDKSPYLHCQGSLHTLQNMLTALLLCEILKKIG